MVLNSGYDVLMTPVWRVQGLRILSAKLRRALWCTVVQCGAVWCNVVQCGAMWCSVVQCGARLSTYLLHPVLAEKIAQGSFGVENPNIL